VEYRLEQSWLCALRWVLTQPGLLEGLPGGHGPLMNPDDPQLSSLLQATKSEPSAFLALLKQRRARRVGPAFEALVQWGLEQGMGYRCIASDVQIFSEKRTIGSMDLLLQAPSGEFEHWELAYKVYLHVDTELGWESWVGPGYRDRLNTKVRRLLDHQLPLSETVESQSVLSNLGIDVISRRRVLLQGVLFSEWGKEPSRATQANRSAQGRWVRPSGLDSLVAQYPNSIWVLREKPLWFGPWGGASDEGISSDKFHRSIHENPLEYPRLWSRLPCAQYPQEEMVFVVPEQWGMEP
jgi:hypothetical protein